MSFLNVMFPETIAAGATGGPMLSVDVVRSGGGQRQVNENWPATAALGLWEVPLIGRTYPELTRLWAFWLYVGGMANSFRFKDPLNHQISAVACLRLTSTTFQIRQQLSLNSSAQLHLAVTKPRTVDPGRLVTLGGIPTTAYTLNANTGIITTTASQASNIVVKYSGEFHFHVAFHNMQHFNPSRDGSSWGSWTGVTLMEERET